MERPALELGAGAGLPSSDRREGRERQTVCSECPQWTLPQTDGCHQDQSSTGLGRDGLDCRAKVQRKVTGDKLMILFVDFGSGPVMRKAEVQRTRDEFLTLPFQAIPAGLQNIRKRSSGVWSDEAINLFCQADR